MKKITLLLLVAGTFCQICFGQKVDTTQMELKLTHEKRSVCVGEPLKLFVRITNRNEIPIVIDAKGIGYKTTLSWDANKDRGNEGGSSTSISHVGTDYVPDFIVLRPNENYIVTIRYLLDDNLFKEDRKYELSVSYGYFGESLYKEIPVLQEVVESNKAKVAFKPCPRRGH
jgi:hypothetical protein